MAYTDKKKQIDVLTDQLNKSISEYKKSPEEHIKLLRYLTQFKNYSIRNTMLIAGQYEGAYGVKSYKEFQNDGYQVRKGQKAIKIMAPKIEKLYKTEKGTYLPVRYAKADTKEKIKAGKIPTKSDITGFLVVPVFDITQTNAPEEDYPKLYPNKPQNYEFKGTQEQLEALEETLKEYAHTKGITVVQGEFNSAAKGAYDPSNNRIILSNRLSDTNRVKTLSHELGHAEMHNASAMAKKDPALNIPEVREYQAEMTAYLIGNQLGLDSEEESTRYISNWVSKNDEFKSAISNLENNKFVKSIEEVKDVSVKMIDQIVERYNQVKQERNIPVLSENHSLKENVATRLNFLNDSEGKNCFNQLRNEKLKAVEVCSIKPKNSYQDHILKLKDSSDNTYKVHITTPKSDKKTLYAGWEKGLTGDQWLDQDMKAKLMQNKPDSHYNVMDLDHPNVDKILQPIENMKQVQQTPSI